MKLRANRPRPVHVLSVAVGDRIGIEKVLVATCGRSSNTIAAVGGRSQMSGVREQLLVPTVTLDALLETIPAPQVLKVDVEGAEALVLRGATRVLRDIRPVLYCEVGDENNEEVTARLRAQDYLLFDGARGEANGAEMRRCTYDTLAIPREHWTVA